MIKIARIEKNLSQKKLAANLGISKSYLSKIENRDNKYNKNITVNLLLNLSKELDLCPIKTFIYITDCCSKCNLKCHNCCDNIL